MIDRLTLADGQVVIEVPLRGAAKDFHLAPEASPDAIAGRWLTGEPAFVVAPDSLRVIGSLFSLSVKSATVISWTLVRDEHNPDVTWLQGLVVIQTNTCILNGERRFAFPFEALYPGEPKQPCHSARDLPLALESFRWPRPALRRRSTRAQDLLRVDRD